LEGKTARILSMWHPCVVKRMGRKGDGEEERKLSFGSIWVQNKRHAKFGVYGGVLADQSVLVRLSALPLTSNARSAM
jgi:hypothetical protein